MKAFAAESEVRAVADSLSERVANGETLLCAMRDVCLRHADLLRELGPVGSLALDPCPMCLGRVVASDVVARCSSCGWSYREAA